MSFEITPTADDSSAAAHRRVIPDAGAIGILLAIIAVAMTWRWLYDSWLAGIDIFTQFIPWFGYVGERLREGQLPAWGPHDSLGSPVAGSPSGGWMYLPVMLAFPFLDVINAYKVFVLVQVLVGGLATYAFARWLGLIPAAAMFAGAVVAVGPMFYGATVNGTGSSAALAFFPLGLLAAEGMARSHRWSGRLAWASVVAIAFVQMYAASPPRCVYGGMLVAGWLGYRWLIEPLPGAPARWIQFRNLVIAGGIAGVLTGTLGAAAILPQLDFISQSTVSGSDYSGLIGGSYASYTYTTDYVMQALMSAEMNNRTMLYVGGVVLVLAGMAVVLGRVRFGMPFFAVSALVLTDLSLTNSLTRGLFNLLPGFESVTHHRPTAPLAFVVLPVALLTGVTIHCLMSERQTLLRKLLLPVPLLLVLWMAFHLDQQALTLPWKAVIPAVIAAGVCLLPWHSIRRRSPQLVAALPVGLLCLFLLYPTGISIARSLQDAGSWDVDSRWGPSMRHRLEQVVATSDPGTGAEFLQDQAKVLQPFRYAPFTGLADPGLESPTTANRRAFDPGTIAILANGRASFLGLEQTTGYHPVHLKYYVDYVNEMNGAAQDYHYLEMMTPAVSGSPLLDMLNVRYVLVAAKTAPQPPIAETWPVAYQDEAVIIYQNPDPFPRAWIVHDVLPALDGEELALFNSGAVDGRVTAYVHGDLPPVSQPAAGAAPDSVLITGYAPEEITLTARSGGDGLLVLSELYADGWNAWVDGEKVGIQRTDHALRGIPLAAGSHKVVLKYQPQSLRIGMWSTSLSGAAILGIWGWCIWDRRRSRPAG